jgi:WKF domain
MSSETVPAWKKLGLKVKDSATSSYDPLSAGLQSSKRSLAKADGNAVQEKKPAKRIKLPKNERKPPPEADQLVYLRQYLTDRDQWKFSKQKQNWILKNLYEIAESYEEALIAYVCGLQGGSKDRVVEEARVLVKNWNEFMSGGEEGQEKDHNDNEEKQGEENKEPENVEEGKAKLKQTKQVEPKLQPPSEEKAKRAQQIVYKLTGDLVSLMFLEEDREKDQSINEGNEQISEEQTLLDHTAETLISDSERAEDVPAKHETSSKDTEEKSTEQSKKSKNKEKKSNKSAEVKLADSADAEKRTDRPEKSKEPKDETKSKKSKDSKESKGEKKSKKSKDSKK